MRAFIVYPKGQRPWPDEVNILTQDEMREKIVSEALQSLEYMSADQLMAFAGHFGLEVQEVS